MRRNTHRQAKNPFERIIAKNKIHRFDYDSVTDINGSYSLFLWCTRASRDCEPKGRRSHNRPWLLEQSRRRSQAGLSCAHWMGWLWSWWRLRQSTLRIESETKALCLLKWGRLRWTQWVPSSDSWTLPSSRNEQHTHCTGSQTSLWQLSVQVWHDCVLGEAQREWECPQTRE